MEKFWNRFKFYLIGLSFGTILVFFMFGNRGCAWLPGNRVKNMIGEKELIINDSLRELMTCVNLSNVDIYALLKNDGKVIFDKSETQVNPKVYFLEGENEDGWYAVEFALNEEMDQSEIVGIHTAQKIECNVINSSNELSILSLPREDVIHILEAQEMRILSEANCQITCLELDEEDVLKFHKEAEIDIKASQPRFHPNPIYILNGTINGNNYVFTYIIGENRTRIAAIKGPINCDCGDK